MNTRVLLIHPPDNEVSLSPARFEPLGLEILAATIPGNEVMILDLRIENFDALDRHLDSFRPDIAGITVNNTIHVKQAKKLLAYIRDRNPEVTLVVGGHHVTMMPQDFYIPTVDIIFLGWAEKSFPGYIRSIEKGESVENIDGIKVLNQGVPVLHNAARWDLKASEIPCPRRDLIKKYERRYRNEMGFKTALVNTARGCPNRCSFCAVWQVTGGRFLMRTPEDVFNEIAAVPDHVHRIFFADDNTFINAANAGKLCSLIRESGIKKKYHGYCRSDTIIRHPGLMREWKKIGLDNLCVGFEGIDSNRLNLLNKKNTAANNEEAARILNEIGIPFRPHFLVEPTFLEDDFNSLIRYVDSNNLKSPVFPILTPIPGTQYYQEVKDKIILDYDFFDMAHSTVPTSLPAKEFYQNWMKLYMKSYCLRKNLLFFVLRTAAKIRGNKKLIKKYYHLRLVNLILLKLRSIFQYAKVVRHYKSIENLEKNEGLPCHV
jgi:radical SAM superfamily enzyme YgiQ (UPF0313 family)